MEGLVDGSPLSSAPTSVSSSPMIISNCSSAPINSSSQILVVQDSTDLINVEYSKAAVPDANEKQMNNEKLQKQVPTVTSGLDSLDDDLFQPIKTAVGVGKFRPKPKAPTMASKSKSFTPAIPAADVVPSPSPVTTTSIVTEVVSLDDILFQPAKTAVGVDKFRPKPKAPTITSKSSTLVIPADDVVPFPSSVITTSIVAKVVSPPSDAQLLSSQSEGLGDGSSLSNAPTSVSSDLLTISNCSSAPINPSSQVIVAQDAPDVIDVEHLKSAVSDANEKLWKNNEELGEQAPTFNSGLDSLDNVLLQPSNTTVRGGGKFRPKPKDPTIISSKSFTAVIPPGGMVPVQKTQPPPPAASKDADSAPLDPSCKVVAQDAVDLVEVEHSGVAVSDANEKIQMNDERLGKQTPTVTSVSDSLDDILFQPSKTTARGGGKFRPKPKAPTTTSEYFAPVILADDVVPVSSPTTTSNVPEFASSPFDPQLSPQIEGSMVASHLSDAPTSVSSNPLTMASCFSAPIKTSSQLLVGQEDATLTDDEHSKAAVSFANENSHLDHENLGMEVPTASSGLDSLDVLFQTITTPGPYSQHLTQQSSDYSETHLETAVPGGDGYLQSDPGTSKKEGTKRRKRRTSKPIRETVGESSTIPDENEAGNMRMQLRKKKAVLSNVDENCDGIDETCNDFLMDDNNGSDEDYNGEDGEDTMNRRKVPRGTKRPATKTDKPSQRRKKASDEADPINKEPAKKKFSHSTRRNRRTVSKELLETPQEDIDHSKLRMKDLIILAEIKERRLNKEAEALKKSFPNQSADNSTPNDAPYDDEDPLASTQALNTEDDQANHRSESSYPKLNYHSFMNRTPSERWSKSETERFFEAVRQFGTDFAMIQQLFPGRTRHQVKLKYKAEERKHPLQVADALIHRSKDHSHFALVIERLQEAQAEQNDYRDADLPNVPSENEEQGLESESQGKEVAKEELEVHSPVKSNASQDYFDWSQYGTAGESYTQDMEECEYVSF